VRATIAGIRQLSRLLRERHPDIPLVLLGHSLGSMFAQMILDAGAAEYDAVVLSGTPFRTLRHMNGGDLAKRHRVPGGTGTEWLTRDEAISAAFANDPLTFDAKVRQLFGTREALRLLGTPRRLARDVPILIQIGSEDTLGGPRSVALLAAAYERRGGATDITTRIYEGARHEVYNEINRAEVIADLVAWLDARLR
jgi:alpha-beta hydrolase superfamily lysophospholipase